MKYEEIGEAGHVDEELLPSVVQLDTVRDNVRMFLSCIGESNAEPLGERFLTAIGRSQSRSVFGGSSAGPSLVFDPVDGARHTLCQLMTSDTLPDDWQYSEADQPLIAQRTLEALDLLKRFNPNVMRGFNTIVGSLFFARKAGRLGGSISDTIGAIWLAPRPDWTVDDYAEHLLHEYVHQCLFVDDMVNQIFPKSVTDMVDDETTSAILKIKRGYDKSYHSAFVAFVITRLRDYLGIPWAAMWQPLKSSIAELVARRDVLSPHGARLLAELDRMAREVSPPRLRSQLH